MKLYFGFNLQSHTVMCHEIANAVLAAEPDSRFAGVMTVKDGPHEKWMRSQADIPYEQLDTTDAIEELSLTYDVPPGRVEEWERRMGRPLSDLIVADRNIGHRYVTGGRQVRTDIMRYDSPEDLRRFVVCFLDTFEERLKRFKPDLVFMPVIASLPALALARVCRYLDIPFVVLRSVRIGNYFILSRNDETERFYEVEQQFDQACQQGGAVPVLADEFRSYMQSYRTESPEQPVWALTCNQAIESIQKKNPIAFYGELVVRVGLACVRCFRAPRKRFLRWKHPFSIFSVQFFQKTGVRFFNPDRFDSPQAGEPYIYFPLHLDPEASTMVLSPEFTDQLSVVDMLAKSIPLTHTLYVKEHPTMIGRRPPGFYKRIRHHTNVRLINPLVNSMELSRQADLIISITGTAGWEAILMGRPVLTLGESFYAQLGFSFHCSDARRLPELIKEILFKTIQPRCGQEDLARFFACLYDRSFLLPGGVVALWPDKPVAPDGLTAAHRSVCALLAEKLRQVNLGTTR